MVKYPLGESFPCWKCEARHTPRAGLQELTVKWDCPECGASNYVAIDPIGFRIGQRLLLAGKDFLSREDYELAAIFLMSSVDATVGTGIRELTIARALQREQAPPPEDDIASRIARMNMGQRVKEYERLAGTSLQDEIQRLHSAGRIKAADLAGFARMKDEIERLGAERNRLVHLGEEVDAQVVRAGVESVVRAIELLETMYQAAFDVRRE